MDVSESDVEEFDRTGLAFMPCRLGGTLLDALLQEAEQREDMTAAYEGDGGTVRSIHAEFNPATLFGQVAGLDLLLDPAEAFLRRKAYVYQLKINMKAAFEGRSWPWHQDFSFWHKEDGMNRPDALTVGIFLDDVSDFNGPMYFIPGSHKIGCQDKEPEKTTRTWKDFVSSDLPYQTRRDVVSQLCRSVGIIAPKGMRGSVVFFHSNIIHASPANISPLSRRMAFITYNSVDNAVIATSRPGFLVNQSQHKLTRIMRSELRIGPAESMDG